MTCLKCFLLPYTPDWFSVLVSIGDFFIVVQDQSPQTPVAWVPPRIHVQALQNKGFVPNSQRATPEVSPTETPYDTEDELEPLPDVNARNPKALRRQNSKEAQNGKYSVS